MHIVVGRPIPLPKLEQPTAEQVGRAWAWGRRCAVVWHAALSPSLPACFPPPAQCTTALSLSRYSARPAAAAARSLRALQATRVRAAIFLPARQVEEHLGRFIGELERLFREHKAAAGHGDATLTIY